METRTIIIMLTLVVAGLVIGCSSEPAAPTTTPVPVVPVVPQIVPVSQFLAQANPKNCTDCYLADADLIGANLTDADLAGADLSDANLTAANLAGAKLQNAYLYDTNLFGADLDGVIGVDFTGALNVPAKYLKD